MDPYDSLVLVGVSAAAVALVLVVWRIVFFLMADADLSLLLKGPAPTGAFEDKVVWITGASQGIGQELAQRFAAMGARLVLSSRSRERLEAVKASCTGKHAATIALLPFDLRGGSAVLREAAAAAEAAFAGADGPGTGGVDVLVLNAAAPRPKLTCHETPEDTLRSMLEVNVVATIELTRCLLPAMIARSKGQILVVSSAAGKLPAPTQGVYAATKHALHGYFNTLRYEVVQHGISVTVVCPGPIATEGSAQGALRSASFGSMSSLDLSQGCASTEGTDGVEGDARTGKGEEQPVGRAAQGSGGENSPATPAAPAAPASQEEEKDARMPASRCAQLIADAAALRVTEAWISRHPVLALLYIAQYFPSVAEFLFRKIGPKRVHALKSGMTNMYSTSLIFSPSASPASAPKATPSPSPSVTSIPLLSPFIGSPLNLNKSYEEVVAPHLKVN